MKTRAIIFLSFFFPVIGFSQLTEFTEKLPENKGKLNAFVHVPNKEMNQAAPLVLVLHGCNQNADEIARSSGWNELADTLGFYVVYPEQRAANNMIKCFNWFLEEDQEKDKGEISSINEMVKYIASSYPIDQSRIYIYGVSAGAAMSVNYMACYPNIIKSGAILAGTAYKQVDSPMKSFSEMRNPTQFSEDNLRQKLYSQNPTFKGAFPQLVIIHGNDDKVVNYGNGEVLLKQWKSVSNVISEETTIVKAAGSTPKITRTDYKDSKSNSVIIFYTADKWGHYLVIDPGKSPKHGGEVTKYAKDGDFFSTYEITKDWNLAP